MDHILTMKIIAAVFAVVFGIPNKIIDYKHRKRGAYLPGNAWEYYAKLSKEGSWEGRFMVWSGVIGIYLVLGILGYAFYALCQ
jgi:hypothetical protein